MLSNCKNKSKCKNQLPDPYTTIADFFFFFLLWEEKHINKTKKPQTLETD